mmetsp:Transcript_8840/g.10580  ORF Transcript_8840/g.10580 Transcript_8840/m.10580 type:complete len:112 (+) Transcript_8840:105-440(+)|eukprot:CAMPEP_0184014068 /NCGR_PEP_ID=MMETSP0954-20121128/5415_1 /TAXON_ID=627963 /ORGANISM="Aplanochytrium sp, Strain PBS07" /LENGTH=111 /DNA_ID=CAMNT_0026294431 /DNA_START=62 /DNA_END=397 /DNA_ORIENTATION=-
MAGKENQVSNAAGASNGVLVISKDGCKYCVKAKDFLKEQSIPYATEKMDPESDGYAKRRQELIDQTGQKTFPWVFVGDEFIGGYTELQRSFDTLRLHDLLKKIGIELEEDF